MNAFFDARCGGCGKRFGWQGSPAGKPPCPKCGKHEGADASDVEAIVEFQRLLRLSYDAVATDLRRMQELSGLSLGQLAARLGVPRSTIENVISGRSRINETKRRLWVDLCGFGNDQSA